MSVPKVSIITSVFNGEKYIAEAIESILRQTFEDFEFILVDDGSSDRTWEIIRSYASRDRRVVAIRNEVNTGVVKGLNRGLDVSRGWYIARQDADDISLPERIAKQVAFLDGNPEYGLVGSRVQMIDSLGKPVDLPNPFLSTENEEIQAKLLDHMCLCGPSIVIRRHSLETAGYRFSDGLDSSEDYDMCLRLAEVGKVASLPDALYLYRQHPQSATSTREFQQVIRKAIALERAISRRFGPNAMKERYTAIARDYLWAAVIAFTNRDIEAAKVSLQKAMDWKPDILDQVEPLETFLRFRTPLETNLAIDYTLNFFHQVLPETRVMNRLCSKLISSIHMKQVFAAADQKKDNLVGRHLLAGIKYDPSWLKNWGVIVILFRLLVSPVNMRSRS